MRERPFGYKDTAGIQLPESLVDKESPERAKEMFSSVEELEGLSQFEKALVLTSRLHAMQNRKGGTIPYVMHPMAVASLLLAGGGDEEGAIGALLHDSIEDQDADLADIKMMFGPRVEKIVKGCTDVHPEEAGERSAENSEARKAASVEKLAAETDRDVLLVSVADKLHNCRSVLNDYRQVGEPLWGLFNVPKERTLWYYTELAKILTPEKVGALGHELGLTVGALSEEGDNSIPMSGTSDLLSSNTAAGVN